MYFHRIHFYYIVFPMRAYIQAYGGTIYLICSTPDKEYSVSLPCTKSRFAPLKQISLPRLQLCGTVLLANRAKRTSDSLEINFNQMFYWTNSNRTLSWIRVEPKDWNTFVTNGVIFRIGFTQREKILQTCSVLV